MNWLSRKPVWNFAVLFLVAGLAWAVCDRCLYQEFEDRFEGVPATRQVSGDSGFGLIGVHYKQAAPLAESDPDLNLYFWMPSADIPAIEVWHPRTNYLMVPKERRYDRGLAVFSWPKKERIKPLNLDVGKLCLKVSDRSKAVYFPAVLSTGASLPTGSYAFLFGSQAGFQANGTIAREEKGQMVMTYNRGWAKDREGVHSFDWDGRDMQGKPAPPGVYVLRITGDLFTEQVQEITQPPIKFLHYEKFR